MAIGTPDWQLARAFELDTEKALEKAYSEDDFPVIASFFDMADTAMNQVIRHLNRAADLADRHGMEKPIEELIAQLEELQYQMNSTAKDITGR